ncbi:MAG: hypothetical protein ACE5DY_04555 [Mariprofundaceae bacterium]
MLEPEGSQVHALEIKAGATINSDYFKGLSLFKKAFPDQLIDGCVIYAGDHFQPGTNWRVLPWNADDSGNP